jgi:hypothetical protein
MAVLKFLENICVFVGGTILILGNFMDNWAFIIVGSILGGVSLVLAILLTMGKEEDVKTSEKIYYNAFNYLYVVGMILTWGFPIPDATIQRFLFDIALTVATFMILIFIWNLLYWEYEFMSIDIADVDFRDPTKKELLPKFLLTSLLLGLLLGGMNFIMKLLYNGIAIGLGGDEAAYRNAFKYSSYILLVVVVVFVIILIFYERLRQIGGKAVETRKKRAEKKAAVPPKEKKPVAKTPAAKKPAAKVEEKKE